MVVHKDNQNFTQTNLMTYKYEIANHFPLDPVQNLFLGNNRQTK
jgi:hypothetical protein